MVKKAVKSKLRVGESWGEWHDGVAYDVRLATNPNVDTYPHDFTCCVEIRDRGTGEVVQARGLGKYIGNFSPVWVTYRQKRFQLTELLRSEAF